MRVISGSARGRPLQAGRGADIRPTGAKVKGAIFSILGSRYASRWEVSEAAALVAARRIRPVVSEVVPLERVGELHAKLRKGTLLGRGAVTC